MMGDQNQTPAPELGALPEVAREAIRAHLEGRSPTPSAEPVGELATPAPVFVTLRQQGELRGCIGELEAHCADLIEETADRAVAAAMNDPRFPPLTLAELPSTSIEVSVLSPLEPVQSEAELDPSIYGIEIRDDYGHRAVLLPDIDGVNTVEEQVAITRQKAWIGPNVPITIRRFRVLKIEED
jgi:AmmeMemoRadiSam system protein A